MKRTRLLLPAALLAALTVVGLSGCTGTAAATTATVTTGQVTISNQQDGFWVTGEGKVTGQAGYRQYQPGRLVAGGQCG